MEIRTHRRERERIRKGEERKGGRRRKGGEAHLRLVEIKSHYLISLCMQLYLEFDVVALWPSHGLVSPYFADLKTESAQVGGIYRGSNFRSRFYWKIGARVELE